VITQRLTLRPWTAAELDDALRLWGDADVMRLLGGPLSRAQIEERLARESASQAEHGFQYWRASLRDGDTFLGCCGLKRTPEPDGTIVVETGFHLLPSAWGRGFASEAARAAITFAFERLDAPAVYAGHHPRNDGSRNVLRKLGFAQIGERFYPPTGLVHPWYRLGR